MVYNIPGQEQYLNRSIEKIDYYKRFDKRFESKNLLQKYKIKEI